MSQSFTLDQLEIIAECMRITASSMLLKRKMTDVDKVRILTVGVVLDVVNKEIDSAKTTAAILAGSNDSSGEASEGADAATLP